MSYQLVIAEKPSVARSIAGVIGADKKQDGYRTKGAAYPYTGKRAFGLHAERSRLCQVL